MSSSEPKNHHYIPQAQLRLFKLQNFENSILQYDKLNNEIKQKNIAKVACSKYFYKVSEKSANDPFYAEKNFSKIEDNGIEVIRQLSESENPSKVWKDIKIDQYCYFQIFLAFQEFRTLSARENLEVICEKNLQEFCDIVLPQTNPELYKNFKKENIKLHLNPEGHIGFMGNLIEKLCNYYDKQCIWCFAYCPKESQFIISDNPIILYSHPTNKHKGGFKQKGSYRFLPLSNKLGLFIGISNNHSKDNIIKLTKEEIRLINIDLASNARQWFYGSSQAQLQRIAKTMNKASFTLSDKVEMENIGDLIHFKADTSIVLHQSIRNKLEKFNISSLLT